MSEKIKNIINLFDKLKVYAEQLYDSINYTEVLIDEFLMFIAIYANYNFKHCPFYELNVIKSLLPTDIIDILCKITESDLNFQPEYTSFLQDIYIILFEWIFSYNVKSTRIKKIRLNVKINLTYTKMEIMNNSTVEDLISSASYLYKLTPARLVVKKNNYILNKTKKLFEYNLVDESNLTLYINQIG